MTTLRTQPALSARYIELREDGSAITFRIFDCNLIGLPFLLCDFAAFRALVASDALRSLAMETRDWRDSHSVWKKCPGSAETDMFVVTYKVFTRVLWRGSSSRDPEVESNALVCHQFTRDATALDGASTQEPYS